MGIVVRFVDILLKPLISLWILIGFAGCGGMGVLAFAAKGPVELCPGKLWVRAPVTISLNDNESNLVCGNSTVEAWKAVPLNQAMVHLTAILQERGFQYPHLIQEDGKPVVDVGQRAYVTEIAVEGEPPPNWEVGRFRKVNGEILTPSLLGSFQKRVEGDLRQFGYACPSVKTDAFAGTGKLRLSVKPGRQCTVRGIRQDKVEGLETQALTRYYAFYPGLIYDANALLLSSSRIEADGILQGTFFETSCDNGFADVNERVVPGAPRILRFGGGLNTERGVIGYVDWKHARIGRLGSSLSLGVKASYRDTRRNIQQLTISSKYYGLVDWNRLYLDSTAKAIHESHENFHTLTVGLGVLPSVTWDNQHFGALAQLGPTINGVLTFRGEGRPKTFYSTLRGSIRFIEHDLELNYADPTSGLELRAQAEVSDSSLLSDITAQTFQLDGRWLWNLGNFSPATFILAMRWKLNATFAPDSQGGYASLPVSHRNFLGGSYDVRGYALKELPGPLGAPLTAYIGSEFRLADVLPWGLQPLALFDLGRVGSRSLTLDSPFYLSVGPGLRWESPIGVFRATLARGWASGRAALATQSTLRQWQFLVGFGEEF